MGAPGTLVWSPALGLPELMAPAVLAALAGWSSGAEVQAAAIDPDLADTAAFCDRYGVARSASANCVVVAGRRGESTSYAACVVLSTTRADVNGAVRRRLAARKASFAAMEDAVRLTGMEYGGITPIGVPAGWLLLVDRQVAASALVVVGSGLRRSKLALPGSALAALPGAEVLQLAT